MSNKFDSSKILFRRQYLKCTNGALASLTYPTGFNNESKIFVTVGYTSNLMYATVQPLTSNYNIYFRSADNSTYRHSDYITYYELWLK